MLLSGSDWDVIRAALKMLRQQKPNIFGAEAHWFHLNPPLTEAEIHDFETRHRITLPQEYAGFLTHVGNGGAGPHYGLFKLGEMDGASRRGQRWRENDEFVGVLCEPFPHTTAWNDLTGEPKLNEDRVGTDPAYEEEYDERLAAWEEGYWSTANVNGAIPICHLGVT